MHDDRRKIIGNGPSVVLTHRSAGPADEFQRHLPSPSHYRSCPQHPKGRGWAMCTDAQGKKRLLLLVTVACSQHEC